MAGDYLSNYDAQVEAVPTPDLPSRVIKDRFIDYRRRILAGVMDGSVQQMPAKTDNLIARIVGGRESVYVYQNGDLQVQAIFREPSEIVPALSILGISHDRTLAAAVTLNPEGGHDYDLCNVYGNADLITLVHQEWHEEVGPVCGASTYARVAPVLSQGFARVDQHFNFEDEQLAEALDSTPNILRNEGPEPVEVEFGDGLYLRQIFVPENQTPTRKRIDIENNDDPQILALLRYGWIPSGFSKPFEKRKNKVSIKEIYDNYADATPYPPPVHSISGVHVILKANDSQIVIPGYPKLLRPDQFFTLDI